MIQATKINYGGDCLSYIFNRSCVKIQNNNKIILGDRNSGRWIRISKDTYNVVEYAIENKICLSDLKELLCDDEDRDYIEKIYNFLINLNLISEDSSNIIEMHSNIIFEITSRCNLNCKHCCSNASLENTDSLRSEQIIDIINKILEYNPNRLVFTGGEPLIRKDFLEILEYTRANYSGQIVLATNGILINKKNIDILKKCCDQIDISIDGVDEESCSKIRGKGVYGKVVSNISFLQDNGFNKITLSMTVSDINEKLVDEFYNMAKKLSVQGYTRRFSPVGRGLENKGLFIREGEDELYIPEDINSYKKNDVLISKCRAGKYELHISNEGDLFPCSTFTEKQFCVGNILKYTGIQELVDKQSFYDDMLKDFEQVKFEDCSNCKVNLFCWTCRGKLNELINNEKALKNRCKILKKKLYKIIWDEEVI